jgi:transposase
MTQSGQIASRIVGIDIAKRKADACIRTPGQPAPGQPAPGRPTPGLRLTQPGTPEGQRAMIAWLRQHQVTLAVMEASGGYERDWAEALRAAGIAVRVVDPKRVRYFARSAGRLAKNDTIDAEMIAWFGETFGVAGEETHDTDREVLDRLVTARRLLVDLATTVRQLDEHKQPGPVLAAQHAVLKTLETQIGELEAAAEATIKANAPLAARAEIIASVPGFGRRFTAGALAWLPELGTITDKKLAALVGVAPFDDESGQRRGERHIRGGRHDIRNLLYMAALGAATRHNPVIMAFYQRLRRNGKKAKMALVACMRKMITILNTMLSRGETWDPPGNQPQRSPADTAAMPATA